MPRPANNPILDFACRNAAQFKATIQNIPLTSATADTVTCVMSLLAATEKPGAFA